MTIKQWPSTERPREKLLSSGAESLSDAELLAIFLRTGVRGKTAVDLARDLLNEFGGLRQILDASPQRFCECRGLGLAKYAQLMAILEISNRHLHETIVREDVIANPEASRKYVIARLRKYQNEVFACISLDTRNRVISFDELFQGSIDTTTIHPREVAKLALNRNAAAVIFAHNHPSGVAEPSQADRKSTYQLMKALESVEVRVLDHLIIGDAEVISMAELGYL